MAKDGTNRGGARIGAGAKKKPLAERIAEGNPGKRELTVIDFTDSTVDLEGQPMPKPSKMLSAKQKNGKKLVAADVYKKTWNWLHERGCAALVSPELLERYAMSVARWIQCEEAITEFGFLAKHPTTGNAIQSPYVAMSQNFMSQTNRLWILLQKFIFLFNKSSAFSLTCGLPSFSNSGTATLPLTAKISNLFSTYI